MLKSFDVPDASLVVRLGRLLREARGFTALELLLTVGIMGVVSSIAVIQIQQVQPVLKGDGAMRAVMSQLNIARELAITQRQYMRVTFTSPNTITIMKETSPTTTATLSVVPFEGGVQFALVTGLPDTPDAFGKSAAIDFGSVTNVKFAPDGTLVNQDGVWANGTVFLALAQQSRSARAVTVLGSTGRIRGYRWTGNAWVLK